jgi:hypothetical protein
MGSQVNGILSPNLQALGDKVPVICQEDLQVMVRKFTDNHGEAQATYLECQIAKPWEISWAKEKLNTHNQQTYTTNNFCI